MFIELSLKQTGKTGLQCTTRGSLSLALIGWIAVYTTALLMLFPREILETIGQITV
jgi:hypothetical protein